MAATTTRGVPASKASNKGESGANGADGADTPDGGKKSKKKMIIIAVVGLLVVGLGAKMTVLKAKPTAAATAAAALAKKNAPPVYGPIVALDEQTLNLADGHFLKLKVVIQLKKTAKVKAATAGEITPELSAAAQAVLTTYGAYSQEQLTGSPAQAKVKTALIKKLGAIYPDEVADIYTPEFLMSS